MIISDSGLLKEQCFVGGAWVGTPDRDVTNPANGEVIGQVPTLGERETVDAVEKANAAFKLWKDIPAKERGSVLRRWFDLIMQNQEDLAQIMTAEQGKPLAESRGETAYGASFIEFFAEEAKRLYGETVPSPWTDKRIVVTKQPIGVVACLLYTSDAADE